MVKFPMLSMELLNAQYLYFVKLLQSKMTSIKFFGSIELICGPMFSGKTQELVRKLKRYRYSDNKCLLIHHTNTALKNSTYKAESHNFNYSYVLTENLTSMISYMQEFDVVAIDEGHFFQQVAEVCQLLASSGKIVLVAGLNSTFQRKPFENINKILPLAETVTKLSSVCVYCGKDAAFTRRTIDCQQIQLVGGEQIYQPVCRKCYNSKKNQF